LSWFGSFASDTKSSGSSSKSESPSKASNKTLIPKSGIALNEKSENLLPKEVLPGKEIEVPKQPFFFEVDSDLEEALEGDSDFEELPDDFVSLANDPNHDKEDKEDSQEHHRRLEHLQMYNPEDDSEDEDEEHYEKELKTPIHGSNEDQKKTQERNFFEKRFEKIAEDYDNDMIGELEESDPMVQGKSNIDQFNSIIEEFLEKQNVKVEEPPQLVSINQLEEDDSDDSKEYIFIEKDEKWDCESIQSTYSNTENHPQLIAEPEKVSQDQIIIKDWNSNWSISKEKIDQNKYHRTK